MFQTELMEREIDFLTPVVRFSLSLLVRGNTGRDIVRHICQYSIVIKYSFNQCDPSATRS
jgi:hypothetical protein